MPSININSNLQQENVDSKETTTIVTTAIEEPLSSLTDNRDQIDTSFSVNEPGTGIDLPGHHTKPTTSTHSGRKDQVDSQHTHQFSNETASFVRERNFLEQLTIDWLVSIS